VRRGAHTPEPGLFALLCGGGTGGHTYPAIAVAQELARRGHTVRFVGGRRGIEGRVVPEAGFEIDLLAGRGLQRRHLIANLAQNVGAIFGALTAVMRSVAIVRRYRPRVVVGFGGYASFPCVLAARILRIPVIVHEQDAAPGLANRMGVRLGARPAISLPGTPLPNATLTGNPVRAAFAHLQRTPQAAGDAALLAVFGGAQGARSVNRAALGCYDSWRARRDVAVHHVCGPNNLDESEAALARVRRDGDALRYELVGYEERMDQLYARAALAVCRAGAGTIAELTAAGLPAVLVPLPGAPSDHQTRNAQTLERAGAAVMLADDECDATHLDRVVSELLSAPGRLERMGAAAYALGRRDAAERLADLVESHARAA
jgi:UDP-N-acetylglucosamine--N-acetylmuramyl-(pentapeptide) pyrophosphoryl-undecaprenol N-acetylglucosamine transferase